MPLLIASMPSILHAAHIRLAKTGRLLSSVFCLLSSVLCPLPAHADGGTVRLSERCGSYQITVFTSPAPLRVGPADVSVFVQDSITGRPTANVESVHVYLTLPQQSGSKMTADATQAAATNKLYRAALLDIPAAGQWHIEVACRTPAETLRVQGEITVLEAWPPWVDYAPWIFMPVLPILLYTLHQIWIGRRDARIRLPATRASIG